VIRLQRPGDGLAEHAAHASEIERHRQNQREAGADLERDSANHEQSADCRRSRAKTTHRTDAVAADEFRRQRRASHVADRADRKGYAKIERGLAVDILQHEG
jgi:hypothetical protein